MCYLRLTFDLFNHLTFEQTAMGAWQAYLLSISKTLLPFSSSSYYTKRELIFTYSQFEDIKLRIDSDRTSELITLNADLSPSVQFKDTQAVVSCCYWNDWGGLFREYAKITFFNDRVYLLDDFEDEKLFEYDCGIRY